MNAKYRRAAVVLRVGDDRLLILSRQMLAIVHFYGGELHRARPHAEEAVERARKLGDDVLLGQSIAVYAATVGAAASGPLYAEAIACTERTGDHFTGMLLHWSSGLNALELGDIRGARASMEAAIRIGQAIGDPQLTVTGNLAMVLRTASIRLPRTSAQGNSTRHMPAA